MTPEILNKSGYRIEITSDRITIMSSRRPIEFFVACFLTLLISLAVVYAKLNDNLLILSFQCLVFLIFIAGPFSFLYFKWRKKVEIKNRRVRITGTIKGEIDNSNILSIDTKIEQSTIKKRVTILLRDSDKGLNELFTVFVKPRDMEQLNEFINHIRKTIGLKNNK